MFLALRVMNTTFLRNGGSFNNQKIQFVVKLYAYLYKPSFFSENILFGSGWNFKFRSLISKEIEIIGSKKLRILSNKWILQTTFFKFFCNIWLKLIFFYNKFDWIWLALTFMPVGNPANWKQALLIIKLSWTEHHTWCLRTSLVSFN